MSSLIVYWAARRRTSARSCIFRSSSLSATSMTMYCIASSRARSSVGDSSYHGWADKVAGRVDGCSRCAARRFASSSSSMD